MYIYEPDKYGIALEWFIITMFVIIIAPAILIVSLSMALIFTSLGNGAKNEVARKRYKVLRLFFMVVFIVVIIMVIILVASALIINPEYDVLPPLSDTK